MQSLFSDGVLSLHTRSLKYGKVSESRVLPVVKFYGKTFTELASVAMVSKSDNQTLLSIPQYRTLYSVQLLGLRRLD